MAMMVIVLIVVPEHPPMIQHAKLVANKCQVIADHLAVLALPNLFPDQPSTLAAANFGGFIHNLAHACRSSHDRKQYSADRASNATPVPEAVNGPRLLVTETPASDTINA